MSEKPLLVAAGNTLIPAFLTLRQKGYTVYREGSPDSERWYAENRTHRFLADDTLTLLGLVTLYEARGEAWPASDEEIDAFLGCHYA